jgi:hypothetical protein
MAEISSGVCASAVYLVLAIGIAYKVLGVTPVVDLDHWLATLVGKLEWPVLSVLLDILIIVVSTNHSLGVKDSVGRVRSSLILCCVSDQSFVFSECDPRWGDSVSLVIGDNLDFSTSLDTRASA